MPQAWEAAPVVQPPAAAPPTGGPGYIPGKPRTPPPQTETNAELDAARLERERLAIERDKRTAARGDTPQVARIPPAAAGGIQENMKSLRAAEEALAAITEGKGRPESIGPGTGMLGDTFTQLHDPGGTNARRAVGQVGAVKIHDLSGAAVSASESPRFVPFVPAVTDTPEVARNKLEGFRKELRAQINEQLQYYRPENGYMPYDTPEARAFLAATEPSSAPAPPGPPPPSTEPNWRQPEGDIGGTPGTERTMENPWTDSQQATYDNWMRSHPHATAAQLRIFAQTELGTPLKNAEAIIEARNKGAGWQRGHQAAFETPNISDVRGKGATSLSTIPVGAASVIAQAVGGPETADAYNRGALDVPLAGLTDEIVAAGKTIFNGRTMRENLARERAIDDYDNENHWGARFAGQASSSAVLPMGRVRTVGQLATRAGAYGLAHGLGSGRGTMLDRIKSGVSEGVTATVTGGAFGLGAKGVGMSMKALFGPKSSAIPPLVDPVTGRLNQPLENATPAQRYAAAQEHGIDLPVGAAGDRTAAIIEKGLDNLPASAGVMNDSRRVVADQVVSGMEGVASRYGTAESLYTGGQAAQRGARNWISRFDRVSSKAYDAIPISDKAPTTLGNSQATLQDLTSKFESNPKLAEIFHNPRLAGYLDAVGEGMSWKDLKEFRSRIGNQIGDQRFSDDPTRDELRALYGALSEDMRASAAAQGPKALHAFERANNLYREGQTRIDDALVAILGDDSKNNPEAAARMLQTIIKSGKGTSNIDQLTQIRASMAKGGEWDDVASMMIRLMGQPVNSAGRDFNPQTFVQNYADMAEPARNLLFADKGRAPLRRALDSFVEVNQRLSSTNALRNTSNTATVLGGMGTVGAAGMAVLNPLYGVKMAAAAGANYGMARAWTHPKFVQWATGYTKLLANKASPAAIDKQFGKLSALAVTDPELRAPIEDLLHELVPAFGQAPQPVLLPGDQDNR